MHVQSKVQITNPHYYLGEVSTVSMSMSIVKSGYVYSEVMRELVGDWEWKWNDGGDGV
jgi:hypothetical protein